MPVNDFTPELSASWDLQVGSDGSLKMARGALAIAQNVSCECKCFKGGCLYFQDHGIDWFTDALGQKLKKTVISARIREAALGVDGVESVDSVSIDGMNGDREVVGEVKIKTVRKENVSAYIR